MEPEARNIGSVLSELAEAEPGAICVEQEGRRYTRADVIASAEVLARHFEANGVTQGSSVAILAVDCLRGIEAMIALWSLGAAVLFLDVRQTLDEITTARDRAEIDLVFSDSPSFVKRGGFGQIPPRLEAQPAGAKLTFPAGSEERDALILSTSGTTGLPRYRRRSHRFFLNDIYTSVRLLDLKHPKPAVIVGSLAFGAIMGHWIRLMVHGQFILSLPLFFRIENLHEALQRSDIATVGLPPVLIRDLLDFHSQTRTEDDGPVYPHLVRMSSVGGPIMPRDLTRAYQMLTPGVHNLYSMSGVGAVSNLSGEDVIRKPGSVGAPLAQVSVRIVNEEQHELGANQIGRVIATPEWKPDAEPVDSGDLGWIDPDGYLYISGRGQQMACRNAINVNLSELEQDIKRISGIRDCIAFTLKACDSADDWIYLAVEAPDAPDLVRDQIRSSLASFRRPDKLLVQEKLPRNASNKIELGRLQSAAQEEGLGFVDF